MPGKRWGDAGTTGFGERLREFRRRSGLLQHELADQVGVSVNTVARLERGEHEPAWPLVLRLADALGVGVEEFRPTPLRGDPSGAG